MTSTTKKNTPVVQANADPNAENVAILKAIAPKDAINALLEAHFGKDRLKFARSMMESLNDYERNSINFQRVKSDDGQTFSYKICGYTAQIKKENGFWNASGFDMKFRDKSGGTGSKVFGDGRDKYETFKTPQLNMLAGFRSGIIKILDEMDTERTSVVSGVDPKEFAELQRKFAEMEQRATRAESERERAVKETAETTQSANKLIEIVASKLPELLAASERERVEQESNEKTS